MEAAAEDWPDVLVSDIGLPGRDGYELVRELRNAFSRDQDRDRTLAAGFDMHLGKLLQPHRLITAIIELVGHRPTDAEGVAGQS